MLDELCRRDRERGKGKRVNLSHGGGRLFLHFGHCRRGLESLAFSSLRSTATKLMRKSRGYGIPKAKKTYSAVTCEDSFTEFISRSGSCDATRLERERTQLAHTVLEAHLFALPPNDTYA
ncbi:hypothetical protein AMTR_s00008p00250540 [Amborella trichopoda]|uniref:Uncharacterized protein n=1 Tax=Amborella trichopoda TaxID=13333 RepID=W1NIY8_AMBTC|nr:hypothetical protein AMTR_s00008p00250540 [Amborella trichopoda]